MIERADIEGSKSNVALNACAVPHASYACGVGKGKAGPESDRLRCYSSDSMFENRMSLYIDSLIAN